MVVPVYDGPLGPLVNALDKDTTHVHRRGRRFWLETMAQQGLVVRRWRGAFRYQVGRFAYLHHPTRLLRSIAPAIFVLASSAS